MISYLLSDAKFWVAVAFVIFVISVFKPVKSILIKGLDEKIGLIRNSIDEATKVREDAEKLLKEIENKEKNLNEDLIKIKNSTKKRIDLINTEMQKKLEYQINRKKELADQKIKQLEQEAITEIRDKTAYYTIETVKKIITNKISEKNYDDLINSSVEDIVSG